MGDPISITKTVEGADVVFTLKPMTAEQAASILSKTKARWNFLETIRREIVAMDQIPLHERDEIKYMALLEKVEIITIELSKAMAPLFQQIIAPPLEEVARIAEKKENQKVMEEVMDEYFKRLFPGEEARKKS